MLLIRNMDNTDEELILAIERHRAPAVGTRDVAEAVDLSRQAVDKRLRSLDEDGFVERYKVGRDVVWYLTNPGEQYAERLNEKSA